MARVTDAVPSATVRPGAVVVPAEYAAEVFAAGPDDARVEVLAWLETAFDGVRKELRGIRGSLRQQKAATEESAHADSLARLVELLEAMFGHVEAPLFDQDVEMAPLHNGSTAHRGAQNAARSDVDVRISALAERVTALAARPEWKALRARLGSRSQPAPPPPHH